MSGGKRIPKTSPGCLVEHPEMTKLRRADTKQDFETHSHIYPYGALDKQKAGWSSRADADGDGDRIYL